MSRIQRQEAEHWLEKQAATEDAESQLFMAITYGTPQRAQRIIDLNPELLARDGFGSEMMCSAARDARANMIRVLAASGVDVNAQDRHGSRPLYLAVQRGSLECVQTLLQLGADPDLYHHREKSNALHLSLKILRDSMDIPRVLLEHGADPNLPDSLGCTAAYLAASLDDEKFFRFVMSRGADPTIESPQMKRNAIGKLEEVGLSDFAKEMMSLHQANQALRAITEAGGAQPIARSLP